MTRLRCRLAFAVATAAVLGAAAVATWVVDVRAAESAATTPAAATTTAAAAAAAGLHYRFRQPPTAGLIVPSADMLTARERAFVAALPVVRVGLSLPDNRPYEVIAANGESSRTQIEILTHIAQSMGLRLKPVLLGSFAQAGDALRERRVDVMATVGFAASREAAKLIPLVNRALADIPAAERERLYRRWVAVDIRPGFAWRRHAPMIITAAATLLVDAAPGPRGALTQPLLGLVFQ